MMKDDEYEVFDIEDFLKGKTMKKKKIKSTTSADFNPFDQGKSKLDKKKVKEELDNLNRNFNKQKLDNSKVKIEDYVDDDEQDESANKKNKNGSEENAQINNKEVSKQNTDENEDYDEKIKFYQKMLADSQGEILKNENINNNEKNLPRNCPNCSMCESATFIDNKIRLKKKENPALMEPKIIKYNLILK